VYRNRARSGASRSSVSLSRKGKKGKAYLVSARRRGEEGAGRGGCWGGYEGSRAGSLGRAFIRGEAWDMKGVRALNGPYLVCVVQIRPGTPCPGNFVQIKKIKKWILKKQDFVNQLNMHAYAFYQMSAINSRIIEKAELGRPYAFQVHQGIHQQG
jgi:hypothetical protein